MAVSVTAIILSIILSQSPALAIKDPSYALSPWPYGAIAWVGGLPDDHQTFSRVLAEAVDDVFALWELPPPSRMQGWEDPSLNESAWKTGQTTGPIPQVIKKDPNTNQLWRLNPLEWEGIEVYSLLYIAFPNRILLAQAFGSTSIGGVWIPGSSAISGSEVWYQALTGVPMSITAPAYDGILTMWHEFAHWMTYLVCLRDDVSMYLLPLLIAEGIAEYTVASFIGLSERRQYAAAWARENALSVELDRYNTYHIGASIVAYLVETQGPTEFLASLSAWAASPEYKISRIDDGWREWLGVK